MVRHRFVRHRARPNTPQSGGVSSSQALLTALTPADAQGCGAVAPPSLDNYNQNAPKRSQWTSRQKRAYSRLLPGFIAAQVNKQRIRHLTLTTASADGYKSLKKDYDKLVKRIRRKRGYYQYFRVKTREGHGVLHVICKGVFLPHAWIRKNWVDIHGAPNIWITDISGSPQQGAAYVVNQYVIDQHGRGFESYGWSRRWVFPGFIRLRRSMIRCHGFKIGLELFDMLLRRGFFIYGGRRYPPPGKTYYDPLPWEGELLEKPRFRILQTTWTRLGGDNKWIGLSG